jgi:rhodanese-related sulfurtransferase
LAEITTVPVIAVCRSGNRSARVSDALRGAGFTADTMTGGMTSWTRAALPTIWPSCGPANGPLP